MAAVSKNLESLVAAIKLDGTKAKSVEIEKVDPKDLLLTNGLGRTLTPNVYTFEEVQAVAFKDNVSQRETIVPVFTLKEKPGVLFYFSMFSKQYCVEGETETRKSTGDFVTELTTGHSTDLPSWLKTLENQQFIVESFEKFNAVGFDFPKVTYVVSWPQN